MRSLNASAEKSIPHVHSVPFVFRVAGPYFFQPAEASAFAAGSEAGTCVVPVFVVK